MSTDPRCCSWRTIALAIAAAGVVASAGFWALTGRGGSTRQLSDPKGPARATGLPEPATDERRSTVPPASPEETPTVPEGGPIVADAWPSHSLNPPNLEIQRGEPTWETEMKVILRTRVAPTEQARRLLGNLRTAPPEAYSALVENAVTRLPDQDYNNVALPILLDAQTDGAALIPLHADLLERPDHITLPALLKMAQTPNHPLAPSALETLALLVGADYGNDWAKWQAAVTGALQTPR